MQKAQKPRMPRHYPQTQTLKAHPVLRHQASHMQSSLSARWSELPLLPAAPGKAQPAKAAVESRRPIQELLALTGQVSFAQISTTPGCLLFLLRLTRHQVASCGDFRVATLEAVEELATPHAGHLINAVAVRSLDYQLQSLENLWHQRGEPVVQVNMVVQE